MSLNGVSLDVKLIIIFVFYISFKQICNVTLSVAAMEQYERFHQQNKNQICSSIDVRNSIDQLQQLKGCEVVEGFVKILLFDVTNETLLSNVSYPELKEITDYLVFYRVIGLKSIGQLFPNLKVIRGRELFNGYALVVFEMSSLQEIGLYSLTDILRGQIRIDKNPSLCFVNSIDWNLIAHEKGEHLIRSSKPENECPICPGELLEKNSNIYSCPKISQTNGIVASNKRLCWNRKHCQKICPSACHSCNSQGKCCDAECLGGCADDKIDTCDVCMKFAVGNLNKQCFSKCPNGSYEYMERRCIDRKTCLNVPKPKELEDQVFLRYPYKIFKDKCVHQCPSNYMDNYEKNECKLCEGRCKRECPASRIDSIAAAQKLKGCTHINGSLEIQIRGSNVVNELEENLHTIEEIDGYLKVVRSFPLVSLNFLKNLKIIHGNTLENDKYAFVVLDNQNLQDLWDWGNNRTIKISKGKLFFHFNPKLCFGKILELQKRSHLPNFTELEVASNSNGDKIVCNVSDLLVTGVVVDSHSIALSWEKFLLNDERMLLGYIVYSMEAFYRNVTLYDRRDACGEDGWRVDDVSKKSNSDGTIKYLLAGLKPFTQYACYVKTYTISSEQRGAQSPIYFFKTLPDVPTNPLDVDIISNRSNAIYIKWNPPLSPNGNVTHYLIIGKRIESSNDLSDRNYCEDPWIPSKITEKVTPDVSKPKSNATCSCEEDLKHKIKKNDQEKNARSYISFEDELHDVVYLKGDKEEKGRKKRSISDLKTTNPESQNVTNNSLVNVQTDPKDEFIFNVSGKTEIYVTGLRHYAYYHVYIIACREKENEEDIENYYKTNCSDPVSSKVQTLKKAGADNITNLQVVNNTNGMVSFTWNEPDYPNGIILYYMLEYKRVDNKNSNAIVQCLLREKFVKANNIHTLTHLSKGNYSVRVMAVSEAKNGQYSDYLYFSVEDYNITSSVQIVFSVIFPLLLIIAIAGVVYYFWRRKYGPMAKGMKLITSVNPEYISTKYEPDEWEVPRKKIILTEEIGQGSFGMVYKGIAKDIKGKAEIKCAIKTVNEHATNRERIEFLNEASVMKAFDTSHVVRLLGVVSQGQPTLVVMELMPNGDLKSYLRSHRIDSENFTGKQPPTLKRIIQMAIEIADGMAYLSAKKFVHRDLAARNCMVAEDLTVKIGDFGMTRDIYETDYYRKGTKGLLPVRWMAPESLKDGVFTSSSDVWSYGVVLWEMATLASQPYQGLSNDQVLRYVIDGGVMERPENCPDKLYTLMRFCWQHKPNIRPTFLDLVSHLEDDASPEFVKISFYHSTAGKEARNISSHSQDDPSTPLHVQKAVSDFSGDSEDDESDMEDITVTSQSMKLKNNKTLKENVTVNGIANETSNTKNGLANSQC